MKDSSEPFDLLMVAFEISERLNGIVEVRSEKSRRYKLTMTEDGRAQDQVNWDYGISVRHRTHSNEDFFSTDNLRSWSIDLNSFIERIRRRRKEDKIDETHISSSQGKLKIGNIDFDAITEKIKPMAVDLMQIAKSNLGDNFAIQLDFQAISTIKTFTSSIGSHIVQAIPTATMTIHLTNKSHPYNELQTMIGGNERQHLSWEKMVKTLNTLIQEAKTIPNARTIKEPSTNLIFSHDAAWTLIHELIGHAVEKSTTHPSYLDRNEGTKIAPSMLSVIDDKGIPGVGTYGFDDEGNKASGTVIVEEGILNSFLYDQNTAIREGTFSTGNARAPSVRQPPSVRQSNLFVESGDRNDGELFEEAKSGFFVGPSAYAFSETMRGRVTIQPQYLQRFERGELKEMYLTGQLSWDFNQIIPKLKALGKSMINHPTFCTKEGRTLGVGMLSPMMMFEEVRIRT
ncbi:MAG: TldD/PmbA family protein [Methanobacteriota archaeon]|nr:MAG: TldD/PmbA family protein [Euryarchaeota archaeon]